MPQGSPRGQGMMRRANRHFVQQQLGEMNLEESAFAQCPTLLGAQPESPERLPGKMPRKKMVKLLVHWMPNSMPAQAKKRMPMGARLGCPQLSSTTEGIAPRTGNALGHKGNSRSPRIDASVFPCSVRQPRRMLSLTKTGTVRLKMPWNMAMMPPR